MRLEDSGFTCVDGFECFYPNTPCESVTVMDLIFTLGEYDFYIPLSEFLRDFMGNCLVGVLETRNDFGMPYYTIGK